MHIKPRASRPSFAGAGAPACLVEVLEKRALMSADALQAAPAGSDLVPLELTVMRTGDAREPTVTTVVGRPQARGPAHRFKVVFRDGSPIDRSAIDGDDVTVSGPNGFAERAKLLKLRSFDGGTRLVASYRVAGPGGSFDASDAGFYHINLSSEAATAVGLDATAGTLGTFKVASRAGVAPVPVAPVLTGPTSPPGWVVPPSPILPPPPELPLDASHPAAVAALREAAAKLGTSEGLVMERMEAVTWSDGSLGCPRPGYVYTQAEVPGFRVIVSGAGQELEYHTDKAGRVVVLCDPAVHG